MSLANSGLDALRADAGFRDGLNVHKGQVTEPHVAATHGYEYVDPVTALS
jgi:alanine dehydrogenase